MGVDLQGAQSRTETDLVEGGDHVWQEVEKSLLAQAPTVPAYNRSNVDFVSKRVGNYQYNPQWGVLLDQLWVK